MQKDALAVDSLFCQRFEIDGAFGTLQFNACIHFMKPMVTWSRDLGSNPYTAMNTYAAV